MKKLITLLVFFEILFASAIWGSDSLGYVRKVISSELKTCIDDTTGYEITQWTSTGLNHPRFSPNGRYVLFNTDRTGIAQVYTVLINLDRQ